MERNIKSMDGFWGITANALLVVVYHLCNLLC